VSWQQRAVGSFMLVVLIGLPVGGTVCDVLCSLKAVAASTNDAASAHHHHADPQSQAPQASRGVQLRGPSTDDCNGHNGTIQEETAVAADRADWRIVSSPLGTVLAQTPSKPISAFDSQSPYRPPLGSAPPTGTPLVLRV